MDETYLTARQVADALSVSPQAVSLMLADGIFPNAVKSGRGGRTSPWRIPQTDLDEIMNKQKKRAQPSKG